jgi:hypothetical protein
MLSSKLPRNMLKQMTYFQHMPLHETVESAQMDPTSQMQNQLDQKW